MKRIILSMSIAAIFAACGNPKTSNETAATQTLATDTTGFSEYKQWKEQQGVTIEGMSELKNNENITGESEAEQNVPDVTYRQPSAERRVTRAAKAVRRSPERAVVQAPERTYGTSETGTRNSTSRDETTGATQSTTPGPDTSNEPVATTTPEVPPTKEKKGWSKAAKGTAMGAGSGAVLGAIISKKKGKGAVIGGIVGAAGGYVLGRSQDKKDGRYLTN
jgi:hypothetical protein